MARDKHKHRRSSSLSPDRREKLRRPRRGPPKYGDLGKQTSDLFSKGYHFGLIKLDVSSLLIITSYQNITMSSKVMQMFSPLFRGLVADTSCLRGSDKKDPMTLILPDYKSEIMIHMMNVLKYGELVVGAEEIEEVKTKVSTLAETLGIRLNLDNNSSLDNPISDGSCQVEKRVKKLENLLQTSIKPGLGTFQENKSMIRIKGECIEESFKEEIEEYVSLGCDENLISKVKKDHDHMQMSDTGKPRTSDLNLEDTSSRSPVRCPKDMNYDEDLSSEDEAFREDESEHEEREDESEENSGASENEDIELDQTDTQPENPGARVEDSPQDDKGGHFRVLRRRRKPVPGPGSQSTTPSPSCSTVRSKRRSMVGHYTYDKVTKKYSCRTCHKEYGHLRNVNQHIKTAHEGVRYPCASCGKIQES